MPKNYDIYEVAPSDLHREDAELATRQRQMRVFPASNQHSEGTFGL